MSDVDDRQPLFELDVGEGVTLPFESVQDFHEWTQRTAQFHDFRSLINDSSNPVQNTLKELRSDAVTAANELKSTITAASIASNVPVARQAAEKIMASNRLIARETPSGKFVAGLAEKDPAAGLYVPCDGTGGRF